MLSYSSLLAGPRGQLPLPRTKELSPGHRRLHTDPDPVSSQDSRQESVQVTLQLV
jgi:hypothetical protein